MSPKLAKSDEEPSSPRAEEPPAPPSEEPSSPPSLGKSHIPISRERQKSIEKDQKVDDDAKVSRIRAPSTAPSFGACVRC